MPCMAEVLGAIDPRIPTIPGIEHVGFSPTRKALLAPRAETGQDGDAVEHPLFCVVLTAWEWSIMSPALLLAGVGGVEWSVPCWFVVVGWVYLFWLAIFLFARCVCASWGGAVVLACDVQFPYFLALALHTRQERSSAFFGCSPRVKFLIDRRAVSSCRGT